MEMAESKNVPAEPKVSPKPSRDARKKHEIPDKILKSFLNREIGLSELDNISKIRAAFLWDVEGVERYRIDVWQKTYHKDRIFPSVKIKYSFSAVASANNLLNYPEKQAIKDIPDEPKYKKQKLF